MDESPGLSDQYRKASPWPLFIALGLPIAELGILFGAVPVAVGGLLLLFGSVAAVLQEAEYVDSLWNTLAALAAVVFLLGGATLYADPLTEISLATRAYAMFAAAIVILSAGVAGRLFVPKRSTPT